MSAYFLKHHQIFYSHNKGAIFLNPIDRNLYSDELQRLLGMFLQYKLETSETDPNNDRTFAVPICIRCGSNHILKIELVLEEALKNHQFQYSLQKFQHKIQSMQVKIYFYLLV